MRPLDGVGRLDISPRTGASRGSSAVDPHAPRGRLFGRQDECAQLDTLIARVRSGAGQALLIRGEAGVGKTALLHYAAGAAADCTVSWVSGVESEMELPFAGLQQLCAPFLDRVADLPDAHRAALETAFGLRSGALPDRLVIGVAVLGLLTAAAAERPLICLVDDWQWLDGPSEGTLHFVARRIADAPIGIAGTVREPVDADRATDLPELTVTGLSEAAARMLFDTVVTGPIDDGVRDQFLSEARGNPLALVELPRGLTPADLAGGFGQPGGLAGRIESSFRRRWGQFPSRTRQLLLVAAAEHGQDPALVWRAAAGLGLDFRDAEPAVADAFVEFGARVRFCHPIARTTVYRSASADERRAAHTALADAIDPRAVPERAAWHRALAASGPDEHIAADLERCAEHVRMIGGVAAAAQFLERAAELTPERRRRSHRAVTAAKAKYHAGAPERALRLLAIAETGVQDELINAKAELLRAQIATRQGRGHDAPLLDAARRLQPWDATLALETYRDAFYAALIAGRLAGRGRIAAVAAAARRASAGTPGGGTPDRLVAGLAELIAEGYAAGVPVLREAVHSFREGAQQIAGELLWLPLACRMAHDIWDDSAWQTLSQRLLSAARSQGALNVMQYALLLRAGYDAFAGDILVAEEAAAESLAVAELIGAPHAPYGQLAVAAWRGDGQRVEHLVRSADEAMTQRGEGQWLTARGYSRALVHNARGDYQAAFEAAEEGSANPDELGLASWSTVELVEAAARVGRPDRAASALRRIGEIADACHTDWALGVYARLRAMTCDPPVAEAAYREAIERLARTSIRTELARAHLVYGEWLRREGRRVDAREQLRLALRSFDSMGAEGFAERARRELLATGERARRGSVESLTQLTDQEAQIARLAAAGLTNTEIGTRLFLSARTVEWHLARVYGKLAISSRRQLPAVLDVDHRA